MSHYHEEISKENTQLSRMMLVIISVGAILGIALLVIIGFKSIGFIRDITQSNDMQNSTPSLYVGVGTQFHADIPTGRPSLPCTIAAVGEGPEGKFAISSGQCTSN